MILINRRLERPLKWGFLPQKSPKITLIFLVITVLFSLGLTQKMQAQGYSGSYWIGSTGADFTSFNDAVDSLEANGMAGAVNLFVYGDTYNERVVIDGDSISGSGTYSLYITNYLGASVVVQDSATSSGNNGVLVLNNMHNLFITGITWKALGTSYFNVVKYTGDCSQISFQSNNFYGQTTTQTNNAEQAIMLVNNSLGYNVDSLYISGNYFYNGVKSIQLNASSGNKSVGNIIIGNELIDYSYMGMDLSYLDSAIIQDNFITDANSNVITYAIYNRFLNGGSRIERNTIINNSTSASYGIFCQYFGGGASNRGVIANNQIALLNPGASAMRGISLEYPSYLDVVYNSVISKSTSQANGSAFYLKTISAYKFNVILNNIFKSDGAGLALKTVASSVDGISQLDYNNYLSENSTYIADWEGSLQENLDSLVAASSFDSNSVSLEPYISDYYNMVPASGYMDNLGAPVTGGTVLDFNYNLRDLSTPDMGAHEYDAPVPIGEIGDSTASFTALEFDGTDSATLSGINLANKSFTIEFWANPASLGTVDMVLGQGQPDTSNGLHVGFSNGKMTLGFYFDDLVSDSVEVTGEWHHWVLQYDTNDGVRNIYRDGVIWASDTANAHFAGSGTFFLGRDFNSTYFDGQIDELRIWESVLDRYDIREWMCKKLTGDHWQIDNLIGYYRFDENGGSTAFDNAGSGLDFTLSGATYTRSQAPLGDRSDYQYDDYSPWAYVYVQDYGEFEAGWESGEGQGGGELAPPSFSFDRNAHHVYWVDADPDYTAGTQGVDSIAKNNGYFGVYVVGGELNPHSIWYRWDESAQLSSDPNKSSFQLVKRDHRNDTSWTALGNFLNLDTAANDILLLNEDGSGEYAIGYDQDFYPVENGAGNALRFDGVNDRVAVSGTNGLSGITNAWTVETWIYVDQFPTTNATFVGFYENLNIKIEKSGSEYFFAAHVDTASNNWVSTLGTTALQTGRWYHVAVTSDGTFAELYVNGQFENDVAVAGSIAPSSGTLTIGSRSNGTEYFAGIVDELRIWDHYRDDYALMDNMCLRVSGINWNFGGLLSYYRFDLGAGGTVEDISGGNNGLLTSMDSLTDWVISGAALGDLSTWDYWNEPYVSMRTYDFPKEIRFTAEGVSGFTNEDGLQLYYNYGAPNYLNKPVGVDSILYTQGYYGIYKDGPSDARYYVRIDYSDLDIDNPRRLIILKRNNAQDSTWEVISSDFNNDIHNREITILGQTGTEYVLGFGNPLYEDVAGAGYSVESTGKGTGYRTLGPPLTATDNFTLEAWVQWKDTGNVYNVAVTTDNFKHLGFGFLRSGGTDSYFYIINNSTRQITAPDFIEGAWYHVALTRSSGTYKMYVNGIDVGITQHPSTPNVATGPFHMAYSGNASEGWRGAIDEVRVWNTPLSETNIRTWMSTKLNSDHPSFTDLLAYYRMDEGAGDTIYDLANNTNAYRFGTPQWKYSGAALGDTSIYDYTGPFDLTMGIGGDTLQINNVSSADGMHLYMVRDTALRIDPSHPSNRLDSIQHWGAFVVNNDTASYTATLKYGGNTRLQGAEEAYLKGAFRTNGFDSTWQVQHSGSTSLNTAANSVAISGIVGSKEIMFGTLNNDPPYAGLGNALDFDGINDHVAVSSANAFNVQEYSFEAWVKPIDTSNNTILSKGAGGGGNGEYILQLSGGKLALYTNTNWYTGTPTIPLNEWSHVASTYDGDSIVVHYLNGVPTDTFNNVLSPPSPGTNSFYIGQQGFTCACNHFTGQIDEVKVWNEEKTADYFANYQYLAADTSDTTLVAYYNFDDEGTDSLRDLSSAAHWGVLQNMSSISDWVDGHDTTVVYVGELASIGDSIFQLQTYDADGDALTYSINGGDSLGVFSVDANGKLRLNSSLDFENGTKEFNLLYSVTDGAETSEEEVLNIQVLDEDEAPYAAFGDAIDFDGVDDRVIVADDNAIDLQNSFTLEGWIKPNSLSSTTSFMISKNSAYGFGVKDGSFHFVTFGIKDYVFNDSSITAGKWMHIAVVVDTGASAFFYLNGEYSGTITGTVNANTNGFDLQIGYRSGSELVDGKVDEVRIWNDIRTASEIQQNYNERLSGSEANLVAYYNMESLGGTLLFNNASSGGLSGTLHGFAGDPISNSVDTIRYSMSELASVGDTIGTLFGLDPDGSSLIHKITAGNGAGMFSVDSISGDLILDDNSTVNFEVSEDYFLSYSVTDSGGFSDTAIVAVEVENVVEDVYAGIGNALDLNSGDYVLLDSMVSNAYTLEAWIKPNIQSSINTIFANSASGGGMSGFAFYINTWSTSDRKLILETNGGNGWASPVGLIEDDAWQHVAVSVNGTSATLYHNGREVTGSGTVGLSVDVSQIRIGRYTDNAFFYDGGMDEVRIWTEARDSAEIADNFNKRLDTTGLTTLKQYLNFDLPSNMALDVSNNLNNGTFFGLDASDFINSTDSLIYYLAEDAVPGDTAGWATGYDTDEDTLTFAALDGDTAEFNIASNGLITVSTSDLDFETDESYHLRYTVTEEGDGNIDTSGVLIQLMNVNDAPSITFGNVIGMNGTSSYASLGSGINLANSDFSISFYSRTEDPTSAGTQYVVGQGGVATRAGLHNGYEPGEIFQFGLYADDIDASIDPDSKWHHWTQTFDATADSMSLYKDGELIGARSAGGNYTGTGLFYLGRAPWGGYLDGMIDELKIYNRTLSATEVVQDLGKRLLGDEDSLIAYYDFDGFATNVFDDRAGSNNGTLFSGAYWSFRDTISYYVSEDRPNGSVIGSIPGTDEDEGDSLFYSLIGGDSSHVSVSLEGEITVFDLDYEVDTMYFVQVTATDLGGLSDTADLIIYINDADEEVYAGFGNALDFDNIDDFVEADSIPALNNLSEYSMEAWVYWEGNPTDIDFILSKGFASQEIHVGGTAGNNNSIRFLATTNLWFDTPTNSFLPNRWNHVAVSYDPGSSYAKVWINAVEQSVTNVNSAALNLPIDEDRTVRIGRRYDTSYPFNGKIDEVRIWKSALDSQTVVDNYRLRADTSDTNLIAYYNFDQEDGLILKDLSQNANHGVLQNMSGTEWVDGVDTLKYYLSENAISGDTAGYAIGWDQDGSNLTYTMLSGDTSFFILNDSTGVLSFSSGNLDFETNPRLNLVYEVFESGDNQRDTSVLQINLTDANDAPIAGVGNYWVSKSNEILIGNTPSLTIGGANQFTFEGWFRLNQENNAATLFSKNFSGFATLQIVGLFNADSTLTFGFDRFSSGGWGWYSTSQKFPTREWLHIALVKGAGAAVTVYVNGVSVLTNFTGGTFFTSASASTGNIEIASDAVDSVDVDEFRFWNEARSAAQIKENYTKALTGNEANLAIYYPFDRVNGGAIADESGTGNSSSVVGIQYAYNDTVTVRFDENSLLNSDLVANLGGLDFDSNDSIVKVRLISGNSGELEIDTLTGELTVLDGSIFNYEAQSSFYYSYEVTDAYGLVDTAVLEIALNNVLEQVYAGLGNGLNFNGSNEFAQYSGELINTSQTHSISFWARYASSPTGGVQEIVSQGGTNARWYMGNLFTDTRLSDTWSPDSVGTTNTVQIPTDLKWHNHTLVSRGSGGQSYYVDGALIAKKTGSYTSGPWVGHEAFRLASQYNSDDSTGQEFFNGDIDEVKIWNRALDSSEVWTYLISPPLASDSSVIAYFPIDSLFADTLYDASGNGNHMELYNVDPLTSYIGSVDTLVGRFSENALAGDTVMFASAWDSDGDPLTFSLIGGDTSYFDINSSTGLITISSGSSFDFESGLSEFLLVYEATESGDNQKDTATVKLFLEDEDEAPIAGYGNAFLFDGVDDYIEVDRTFLPNGLTYSAWIRTTSTDATVTYSGNAAINIIGDSDNAIRNSFGIRNGLVRYSAFDGAWTSLENPAVVNDGEWHHVAVSHSQSSGAIRISVDGGPAWTTTKTYNAGHAFSRIGGSYLNGTATGELFDGEIAEVAVFDTALAGTGLTSLHKTRIDESNPNLVLYVPFDFYSGSNIADRSSSELGLVMQGFTTGFSVAGPDSIEFTLIETTTETGEVANVTGIDPEAGSLSFAIVNQTVNNAFAMDAAGSITVQNFGLLDYETDSIHYINFTASDPAGNVDTGLAIIRLLDDPNELMVAGYGGAISFDGTVGDRITADSPIDSIYNNFSASVWFKTPSAGARTILNIDGTGDNGFELALRTDQKLIFGGKSDAGAARYLVTLDTVQLNQWQNVTIVIDSNQLNSVYLNGVLDRSQTIAHSTFDFSNPADEISIGVFKNGGTQNKRWVGEIDELSIWDKALTAAEAKALYANRIDGIPAGLLSYYPFDFEDSSSVAIDRGPNNNNGQLFGLDSIASRTYDHDTLFFSLDENPSVGDSIGQLVGWEENGSALVYRVNLSAPFDGALTVDSLTGELQVLDPAIFDYELSNELTASYRVSRSGSGIFDTSYLKIRINEVNEAPTAGFAKGQSGNGSSNYLELLPAGAYDIPDGQDFTIEFAFKLNSFTGRPSLFSFSQNGLDKINTYVNNNKVEMFFRSDNGVNTLLATDSIQLNEWNFVAIRFDDNGQVSIIRNGNDPGGIGASVFNGFSTGGSLLFGDNSINNTFTTNTAFDGEFDEIRIWKKALSSDELMNYSRQIDIEDTNLLAYFPLEKLGGQFAPSFGSLDAYAEMNGTDFNPARSDGWAPYDMYASDKGSTGDSLDYFYGFDPEADELRFTLVSQSPNNGAFQIDSTTGLVTVADASVLDYYTDSVYDLDIEVREASGTLSDTGAIQVYISTFNEAPYFTVSADTISACPDAISSLANLIVFDDDVPDDLSSLNITILSSDTSLLPLTDIASSKFGDSLVNVQATPSYTTIATNVTITVIVSDQESLTDTAYVVLQINPAVVANAGTVSEPTCNGDIDGFIIANPSFGTAPFTYIWSNGATDDTNSVLSAANYAFTVTDANGCFDSTLIVLGEPDLLTASITSFTNPTCYNYTDGSLNVTTAGGTLPYSFTWNDINNQTDSTATSLGDGTYAVTVTDINGCTAVDSSSITEPAQVVATISFSSAELCFGDTATLSANVGAGLSYQWKRDAILLAGKTDSALLAATAGSYSVLVTDSDACFNESVDSFLVVNALPLVAIGNMSDECAIPGDSVQLTSGSPASGNYIGVTASSVLGGYFFPDLAGPGLHQIALSYTDSNSCTNTDTSSILVNALPIPSLSAIGPFCDGDSVIALTQGSANVGGVGVYGGNGVGVNNFNPSVAGAGLHTITYTFTDSNACVDSASVAVTVNAKPTVSFSAIAEQCFGNNNLNLTFGSALPSGGSGFYAGNGVSGSTFNPNTAGVGTHQLQYIYTDLNSCTDSAARNVKVNALPAVSLLPFGDYCRIPNDSIQLTQGIPGGGIYSGTGVSISSVFVPSNVSSGTYSLNYAYTNAKGCTDSASGNIVVNSLPIVSFSGAFSNECADADSVNIGLGLPTAGGTGTYTGLGVSGTRFYPSISGAGTQAITYHFVDGNSCEDSISQNIVVDTLPVVNLPYQGAYCADVASVSLAGGTPLGGSYSGTNVSGTTFTPSSGLVGNNTITYTYTDGNSCTSEATANLTVDSIPVVSLNLGDDDFCVNEVSSQLSGGIPLGGNYTGTGLNGNNFYPDSAGVGTYNLTYTFTDANGCSDFANDSIHVLSLPVVGLTGLPDVCVDAPLLGFFQGTSSTTGIGVYSGAGVSAGQFNPSVAGVGTHIITYSFTDLTTSCVNSDTSVIRVNALPSVNLSIPNLVCVNQSSLNLTGGSPSGSGGVYGGSGVVGSTFFPSNVGVGSTNLRYTYTDANGCVNSDTTAIEVKAIPFISITSIDPLCIYESAVALSPDSALSGGSGVYSGVGVVSGNSFDPAIAGVGTRVIKYTWTDTNNCKNDTLQFARVNAKPTTSFSAISSLCENNNNFVFTQGSTIGTGGYGYYKGRGVRPDSLSYSPSLAGAGLDTITYVYVDGNSCVDSSSQTLLIDTIPVTSLSSSMPDFCEGDSPYMLSEGLPSPASANETGVYNGLGVLNGAFYPLFVTSGNNYPISYTFTDANGCASTVRDTIAVNTVPVVNAANVNPYCENESSDTLRFASVSSSFFGIGTYSGLGVDSNGLMFNPDSAGIGNHRIEYVFTDTNTSCSASNSTYITVYPVSQISMTSLPDLCLSDQAKALVGASPVGGIYSGTGVINNVIDPILADTGLHVIRYQYTNLFGCVSVDSTLQRVHPRPSINLNLPLDFCDNQNAYDLAPFGIPTGGVFSGIGVNSNTFLTSVPGRGTNDLTYTYTDSNSCVNSRTVTISVVGNPNVSASNDTVICPDAEVLLEAFGGVNYQWSTGEITNSIRVSPASNKTYKVTVTDSKGCSGDQTIEVLVTDEMFVSVSSKESDCGLATGIGSVQVNGGVSPYQFVWSNGYLTDVVSGLKAGVYQVSVTDAKKCAKTAVVAVADAGGAFITQDAVVDPSCFGSTDGSIDVSVFGGTSPYTLRWNTGDKTEDLTNLGAGTYLLEVVDDSGCVSFDKIDLVDPTRLELIAQKSNATCSTSVGWAKVNASGDGPFTYAWNLGSTNDSIGGLNAGIYNVVVTDGNNCVDSLSFNIQSSGGPTIVVDTIVNTQCGIPNGSVVLAFQDTSWTYNWSNGVQVRENLNLTQGRYIVTATDFTGCTSVRSFQIDGIAPESEDLCMITVDTNTNEMLVYFNTGVSNAASYEVYRNDLINNTEYLVGSTNGTPSNLRDLQLGQVNNAWSYKLAVVDSCGERSEFSSKHQSINLDVTRMSSGSHRLRWTPYVGFKPVRYRIFRRDNNGGLKFLNAMSSLQNTYFDVTYPTNASQVIYYVAAERNSACEGRTLSFSNPSRNAAELGTDLPEVFGANTEINVYPNPNDGHFTLEIEGLTEHSGLEISDARGRIVYVEELDANASIQKQIELHDLSPGVYLLKVMNSQGFFMKKIQVTNP